MIEIITLVLEDDLFAQHTKTMCEATRNKKLTVIVFCQFNRNMFPNVGEPLRISTATSRTAPLITRTNCFGQGGSENGDRE